MLTAALVVCAASLACGKKGPPLAPIVHVPSAVDKIGARRVGNDVYVTLTVPSTNIDSSKPADVARIEIYAYTGVAMPPRPRFLEVATLVGTITVQPPVLPEAPADQPAPVAGGVVQGVMTAIRDELTPEELVAMPPPAPPAPRAGSPLPLVPEAPATGPLRRFYTALAFSPRGRPGPPGGVAELPIVALPDPPTGVQAAYTADTVTLAWEPSGGIIGFLFDRPLAIEPAPVDEAHPGAEGSNGSVDVPSGPTRYNVYRDIAPDPLELPVVGAAAPSAEPATPAPVNMFPLDALEYIEDLTLDERQRCYTVTAVRGVAPNVVEGQPSARMCVTPVDTFPPATPTGLSAIGAEGVISLIWEPNVELDLAGYLVLRGEAGSATLAPLTDEPIADTRFTDRQVQPGVQYVYAVVAVDNRVPLPNMSEESARVEGTAR